MTILDLLDNFIESNLSNSKLAISFDDYLYLKDQVSIYYENYIVEPQGMGEFRSYFGSYIAENFDIVENNNYLKNSLLYCHRIMIPCPIYAYFFHGPSDLEYFGQGVPPTFKPPSEHDKFESLGEYVLNIHSLLSPFRELIENESIVFYPSLDCKKVISQEKFKKLYNLIGNSPKVNEVIIKKKFRPIDIATNIDRKGLFIELPGSNSGVRRGLQGAVSLFLYDFILALDSKFTYTAPGYWERYLCEILFESMYYDEDTSEHKIVRCLANSRMPCFDNISINSISKIRKYEEFEEFREELWSFVKNIEESSEQRIEELANQIARETIIPIIKRIKKTTKPSWKRMLGAMRPSVFSICCGVLQGGMLYAVTSDAKASLAGGAPILKDMIQDMYKAYKDTNVGSLKIWSELIVNKGSGFKVVDGHVLQATKGGWPRKPNNSSQVSISSGSVVMR